MESAAVADPCGVTVIAPLYAAAVIKPGVTVTENDAADPGFTAKLVWLRVSQVTEDARVTFPAEPVVESWTF